MGRICAHATEGIPSLAPHGPGRGRGERSVPSGARVLGRTSPALSAFLTSECGDASIGQLKDEGERLQQLLTLAPPKRLLCRTQAGGARGCHRYDTHRCA